MNKKIFGVILSVLTVVATLMLLSACSGDQPDLPDQSDRPGVSESDLPGQSGTTDQTSQTEQGSQEQEEKTFKISFVSNDGGVVEAIEKKAGEEISEPAVPVKEGFVFDGWYESSDNGSTLSDKPFVFGFMPARDCTLYAKWSAQIVKYTITFESNGGAEISAIEKKAGEEIEEPAKPVKAEYIFCGWYESPDNGATLAEKPFVFAYMPARSVKLYARWALKSIAGRLYKQSDTHFNWKSEEEKSLFLANSTLPEEELIAFYQSYKFEFAFLNDEQVTVSFNINGKYTYNLYYEITADNYIKFYETAKAKEAGTVCRIALLTNQFKVSTDRSSVTGIFKHGVNLPGGAAILSELNIICTVNGN